MTRLDRYSGGLAGTTLLAAAGLLAGSPTLLVAAAIPTAFVAYGALTRVRFDPEALSVERSVSRTAPLPGERVRVRLSVENDGPPVTDLRVADGVPEDLAVVEGSPRGGFALGRGGSATLEYVVVARRGRFEFGPVRVRARNLSGSAVETRDVEPAGTTDLTCEPSLDSVPVRRQTGRFAGTVRTEVGGSGVEFHSTREYRRGDPVNRIDWRRLAKTGDLTTVDYREHRAARVLLLVDSRRPSHVAPVPGAPTAAATCAHGAGRVMDLLLSEGHHVGTAALGLVGPADGPALVAPGRGEEHRIRARELLDAAAELPDDAGGRAGVPGGPPQTTGSNGKRTGRRLERDGPPSGGTPGEVAGADAVADGGPGGTTGSPAGRPDDPVRTLSGRLPANTQVILFTPALDGDPEAVTRTLSALGHRVTVVSPDVTTGEGSGARLLAVERDLHLESLRAAGANVVDWDRDRPLAVALAGVLDGIRRAATDGRAGR